MSGNDEFEKNNKPSPKVIKEQAVSVEHTAEQQMLNLDKAQKNLVNVYKNEPSVAVRIAPSYAKYFGRVMRVSINGISIAIKCDGSTVNLPESFAAEVMRRMTEMDKYEMRQGRLADVRNNAEAAPGQIKFFG